MLRAIMGFDHVVKNVNDSWVPTLGYPITKTPTGTSRAIFVNNDGAIQNTPSSGTQPVVQVQLDMRRYLPVLPITGFSIGLRHKQIALGNVNGAMYLATDAALSNNMNLINFSSYPNIGVAGSEFFLDMTFDLTAGTVSYWLDDVFLSTVPLTTVTLASLRNGSVFFTITLGAANTPAVASFKDLYFTDNIPGDGYTGRIGPRKCYPISLDSAVGADWTVSDGGSILTALNAPIETAGATVTSNSSSKGALTTSLVSTVPAGAVVEGIALIAAAKVDVISSLTNVKLVNGGKNIDGGSKAFTTALTYGNPLGAFARDPSGARWTAASIDSTSVVLTPDVVS